MKASAKTALGAAIAAGTGYVHLFTAAALETWASMGSFVTLFKVLGWGLMFLSFTTGLLAAALRGDGL